MEGLGPLLKVSLSEFGKGDEWFSSLEAAMAERRKRYPASAVGPWSEPKKAPSYGGKEVWYSVAKWYSGGWSGSVVKEWEVL